MCSFTPPLSPSYFSVVSIHGIWTCQLLLFEVEDLAKLRIQQARSKVEMSHK